MATRPARWRIWPVRVAIGHRRLLVAIAVAAAIGLLLPSRWALTTRLLLAWSGGVAFYFAAAGLL